MSGPTRKDPAERKRSATRDAAMVVIHGRIAEPPPAPPGVLASTRDAWGAFWRSKLAAYISPQTDGPALVRLFTLVDERARAYRAISAKGSKRVVTGSKGQPVLNPLYAAIAAMDPEIRQLEDRFGLSPRARLNLGIKLDDHRPSLDELNAGLDVDDAEQPVEHDPRAFATAGHGRRSR